MMISRSRITLCLSSLFSFVFAATASQPQPISYKEVGDPLIAAIGFIDKEKKELTPEEKLKALKEIPQLSEGEKLKLVFEILDAHGQHNPSDLPTATHQALRTTMKELELFFSQGANSHNHLFSRINRTTTVMGQAALAKMIMEPIADIQKLRSRQAFIQELLNNDELRTNLETMLTNLAKKESDLLSFWQKTNPVSEQVMAMLYLPFAKNLNSNSCALASWRTLMNIVRFGPMAIYASLTLYTGKLLYSSSRIALSNPTDSEVKKNLLLNFSTSAAQNENGWRFGYLPKNKKRELLTLRHSLDRSENLGIDYASTQINIKNGVIIPVAGMFGLCTGVLAMLSYQVSRQMTQEHIALKYMQTRLAGAARLLTTAEKINTVIASCPTATQGLFAQRFGIEHLKEQQQKIEKLKTLISHLEKNTFMGDYSFFSHSGRILAAFNLIQDLKNEFAGLMQAIGEIDACLSIAKLYKELQHNNATYCFVEFAEHDTPYLHLEEFWNPIIDHNIVVTNSIELGGTQSPRNIVVTGSNTGGKSTILKAIVANIMLSRLGIAPARKAVMTPFTYVATSMNIGDDTASGVSLFKAEVLRAKNILNNVKSLQPHQHAFLAIDELFVGTASEKGEEAACKFAETLNALPNTMFTFATHFKKATSIESSTNGACKNYKVEAFKNENGDIVRPFKLEPGISTSNIANDILQENISSIDFLESSVEALA